MTRYVVSVPKQGCAKDVRVAVCRLAGLDPSQVSVVEVTGRLFNIMDDRYRSIPAVLYCAIYRLYAVCCFVSLLHVHIGGDVSDTSPPGILRYSCFAGRASATSPPSASGWPAQAGLAAVAAVRRPSRAWW